MKDASELQKGDDVNEGGALVGLVSSITATRNRAGRPIADVNLALYKNVEPLPADTRFTARLKGSIGVKYLQVSPGRSRRGLPNGATVPVSQTGASTDLDQVLNMFTPPTRKGVQQSTIGFGEAVAGRGYDINRAIVKFLPLTANLLPVDDEPGVAEHRPGGVLPRSGAVLGRAGAGRPDPGDRCSPTSTRRSRRSPGWRRRCRTRSRIPRRRLRP